MKIKDYKCKCGRDEFFFADKGNQRGIFCAYCGKWLKWADKDERNLALKQEPLEDLVSKIKMYEADCLLIDDNDECKACDKAMFTSIYRILGGE